jgi:hypothetical protein
VERKSAAGRDQEGEIANNISFWDQGKISTAICGVEPHLARTNNGRTLQGATKRSNTGKSTNIAQMIPTPQAKRKPVLDTLNLTSGLFRGRSGEKIAKGLTLLNPRSAGTDRMPHN